jgi:hypothetical protein
MTARNARELSRHFNKDRWHPGTTYDRHRVWDVPAEDWVKDTNMAATEAAIDTASFYQELTARHTTAVDNLAQAQQNHFTAANGFGR